MTNLKEEVTAFVSRWHRWEESVDVGECQCSDVVLAKGERGRAWGMRAREHLHYYKTHPSRY